MSKSKGSIPSYWKRKEVRSGLEAKVRKNLDERKVAYEYETVKLPYVKLACPHCKKPVKKANYIPDFIIGNLIVEVKGRLDATARAKMKAVREAHPDKDIRILFQRDQKLSKQSKTLYSEWAVKVGYPFAIGEEVPEEWLKASTKG